MSPRLNDFRPGWYQSQYGGKRYWDGERWTNQWRRGGAGERRASHRRKKGVIVAGLLLGSCLAVGSLVGGRSDEAPPLGKGATLRQEPVHEHPRHGRIGEPLMLSHGELKLVITPTRLLDPLDVGAAHPVVGGYDHRVVGLEVRTTNVGHESYGLSAEDISLMTERNNSALPTDLVEGADCLGSRAADPRPVGPGATATECYQFKPEPGEGLKEMRIAVTDGTGTATGIWSLR